MIKSLREIFRPIICLTDKSGEEIDQWSLSNMSLKPLHSLPWWQSFTPISSSEGKSIEKAEKVKGLS
jgi:hypothetical protein